MGQPLLTGSWDTMADWFASLPPATWLLLLLLIAAIPLLVCTALLIVAFVPSGAGRAGWRDRVQLPGRPGVAAWSELHPAFPVPSGGRHLVGRPGPEPDAQPTGPRPVFRPALARVVTDLQRVAAQLVRSPVLRPGRPSGDSA